MIPTNGDGRVELSIVDYRGCCSRTLEICCAELFAGQIISLRPETRFARFAQEHEPELIIYLPCDTKASLSWATLSPRENGDIRAASSSTST